MFAMLGGGSSAMGRVMQVGCRLASSHSLSSHVLGSFSAKLETGGQQQSALPMETLFQTTFSNCFK